MKLFDKDGTLLESEELLLEHKESRSIGAMRIGKDHLFYRTGLRTYVVPYSGISRIFRRVEAVPAKMCCGNGNFDMESIVFCDKAGNEITEISLPDTKAAKLAFAELQEKAKGVEFGIANTEPSGAAI